MYETHGLKRHPLYMTWVQMRQRCSKPENYPSYKGITVCKRWQSFSAFLEDVGERPAGNYTLDRRNNNGPYSPSNCRWATRGGQQRHQALNAQHVKLIFRLRGDGLSQQNIADLLGIHQTGVSQYLNGLKDKPHYIPLACNRKA